MDCQINFSEGLNVTKATVYFSTELNAYGAVWEKWLDGQVHPYNLERGMDHSISITEVRAYEYVKSKCSELSFYQCLSTKLLEDSTCKEHGNPCSFFTMPTKNEFETFQSCDFNQNFSIWTELTGLFFCILVTHAIHSPHH